MTGDGPPLDVMDAEGLPDWYFHWRSRWPRCVECGRPVAEFRHEVAPRCGTETENRCEWRRDVLPGYRLR